MSPRTGRPKVEKPKSNDIKVRVDNETATALDKYCEKHNVARAEAIRRGINLLLEKEK